MTLKELGQNAIYVIEEIVNESKSYKREIGLISSLNELYKFATFKLLYDDNNNLFYESNLQEIIDSNITQEELFNLCCCGWELSEDKKCLIKKI
mgnify:CR=1 FL=1